MGLFSRFAGVRPSARRYHIRVQKNSILILIAA